MDLDNNIKSRRRPTPLIIIKIKYKTLYVTLFKNNRLKLVMFIKIS